MLHVVYRSYGGENYKSRPAFYSKLLALTSFVRAAEAAEQPVEIVFLNDGPIPTERLEMMRSVGEIVAHKRLGFRGSYHTGLALPLQRGWPDEDLVWFGEDDYLYQPHALRDLIAAADALPQAGFLALYASNGHRGPESGQLPDYAPIPSGWQDSDPIYVNGHAWQRALSTTWTFGARMRALRRDHKVLSLTDYAGLRGCDHAMCLHYQGYRPYPWRWLARDVLLAKHDTLRLRVKSVVSAPVKAAFDVWSYRRANRGHQLWSADPALITHMQQGHLGRDTDWGAVAHSCADWAAERGVSLRLSPEADPAVAQRSPQTSVL